MSKNVIVDIDGVIHSHDFKEMTRREFGVSIPNELIHTYSVESCLGITEDECRKMWKNEVDKGTFNPIPGAVAGIKTLRLKGYDVVIFTKRTQYTNVILIEEWLNNNDISFSWVAPTYDALPDRAIAAIDDDPRKLLKIYQYVNVDKLLLFEQPWNCRCHDIKNRFSWVAGWKDILEEFPWI